jgi:hypothetical protein
MDRLKRNFTSILLALLLLMAIAGCASTKPSAERSDAFIQYCNAARKLNIAIMPIGREPYVQCIAFDPGRGRAAAKGASELGKKGAIGGLTAPFYLLGQCRDPREGVIVLVLLPVLVPACGLGGAIIGTSAGAIGGAIKGDYKEMPMSAVAELEEVAEAVAAMTGYNKALAEHLMAAGQKLTNHGYALDQEGDRDDDIDAVFKIYISRLVLKGEIERDPDISFDMEVTVAVTDPAETVFFTEVYYYASDEISLSNWTKHDGQPLREELTRCYEVMSARIIKDIFMLNQQR